MMRRIVVVGLLASLTGCESMNHTGAGATAGGIFGGALGAIVGCAAGRPLAGAAIGAGTGAAIGGLAGHAEDKREERYNRAVNDWKAAHPPVTKYDVIQMSQRHIEDNLIIQQIDTTGSTFALTADDIQELRSQGVSQRVVTHMQYRQSAAPYGYRYGRPAVVYVEPPPPPVVGVGIGFGNAGGPPWR